MTIAELQKTFREQLTGIYGPGEAAALTRIVLEDVLDVKAAQLVFERFRILTVFQQQQLSEILQRLLRHEPVQYILGQADFCGLKLIVTPAVLVPRPETEELVMWITETLTMQNRQAQTLLDIGTGSGCIPVTLAAKMQGLKIAAMDVSDAALAVAESNRERHGVQVQFFKGDILTETLPANSYDIIVSNPPYILPGEAKDMAPNVLEYEPRLALFVPQNDALLFYRAIATQALHALKPGGFLFFEINAAKGQAVVQMLKNMGFLNVALKKDLNGHDRMIKTQL